MSKQIHDDTQRKQQVKFRAPEPLVDDFDDARDKSRAELFREFMEDIAGNDTSEIIIPDDDDLAQAYQFLVNRARPYGDGKIVNFGDVQTKMSEQLNCPVDALKTRYLRRLRRQGYIGRPTSGRFEVKPLDADPNPTTGGQQ